MRSLRHSNLSLTDKAGLKQVSTRPRTKSQNEIYFFLTKWLRFLQGDMLLIRGDTSARNDGKLEESPNIDAEAAII